MVVGFLSEAAWQSTPKRSKTIAAQRLSSTTAFSGREPAVQLSPYSWLGIGWLPPLMLGVRRFAAMRYWITVSVVLASALLFGCVHTGRANAVKIRTVRFTGDTFFTPSPQPIWRFAITNSCQSEVCWQSGIETSGDRDPGYSRAGGLIEWPEGILASGQGCETNMIVPAKSGSAWRAYVEFWTLSPEEAMKCKIEADKFGLPVFHTMPTRRKILQCNDEWHH